MDEENARDAEVRLSLGTALFTILDAGRRIVKLPTTPVNPAASSSDSSIVTKLFAA